MKQFKFEVIINEEDLVGDEFWEEVLQRDGTGILELSELVQEKIKEVFSPYWEGDIKEVVKLTNYNS